MIDQKVDKKRYEHSLSRLYDIFSGISGTASEVSTWRCPYKNMHDQCTASFGCQNQNRNVPEGKSFICTGSDLLDYRSAWEVQ